MTLCGEVTTVMPLPAKGSWSERVNRDCRDSRTELGVLGPIESTRDWVEDTDFDGGLFA